MSYIWAKKTGFGDEVGLDISLRVERYSFFRQRMGKPEYLEMV